MQTVLGLPVSVFPEPFISFFNSIPSCTRLCLVDLLLLVNAVLSWSAVDQEEEAADDREDLEEIVLGEILVGMVLVEL